MNLYLAGPMTGIQHHNTPAFRRIAAKLRTAGHFVYDPSEAVPAGATYRQAMSLDLGWICHSGEGMVLLRGWRDSRGAVVEEALARALEIPCWEYPDVPDDR